MGWEQIPKGQDMAHVASASLFPIAHSHHKRALDALDTKATCDMEPLRSAAARYRHGSPSVVRRSIRTTGALLHQASQRYGHHSLAQQSSAPGLFGPWQKRAAHATRGCGLGDYAADAGRRRGLEVQRASQSILGTGRFVLRCHGRPVVMAEAGSHHVLWRRQEWKAALAIKRIAPSRPTRH